MFDAIILFHNLLIQMFQQSKQGICIKVKVIPKASNNQILGWENGELKVRLAAVPEKGEANKELLRYLAEILGVSQSTLRLLRGEKSRHKHISITEVSLEKIQAKLVGVHKL